MKTSHSVACTLAAIALWAPISALAQRAAPTIQLLETFEIGGQTRGPSPQGISRKGRLVGLYQDVADNYRTKGFFRARDGRDTSLIFPGETTDDTVAEGINAGNTICGYYDDSAGVFHGWLLADGTYSNFDLPSALNTLILGINDAGDFVGTYNPAGASTLAFSDIGGAITTLDLGFPTIGTLATAISSNGIVTGYYTVSTETPDRGFIRAADGTLITGIEAPVAHLTGTLCRGVNSRGWVVGSYWTQKSTQYPPVEHAFFLNPPDQFVAYDYPSALSTTFTGINDHDDITGYYYDEIGLSHGLILRVVR